MVVVILSPSFLQTATYGNSSQNYINFVKQVAQKRECAFRCEIANIQQRGFVNPDLREKKGSVKTDRESGAAGSAS